MRTAAYRSVAAVLTSLFFASAALAVGDRYLLQEQLEGGEAVVCEDCRRGEADTGGHAPMVSGHRCHIDRRQSTAGLPVGAMSVAAGRHRQNPIATGVAPTIPG
ncbi:exported hypothetical protein [uncultured Stenotrophomonas sp.]|uniref:Secreted protein n=1 Tax=uncultured Stenotrophomonas sp. TaxID=165438 RepID=A0A1Y5Q1L7_9GAMM|nr:exported hypothetical protein [uncultured Stenotrophomonas sp.]